MAGSGDFDLHDEDRLPWLETVDDDYSAGPSIVRTLVAVLAGLLIVSAIVYVVFRYQDSHGGSGGGGALIAAPPGDYKVKPDQPGGMKVEGEGDTAFATSVGKADGNAQIDLKGTPEAPVTSNPAATPAGGAPAGNDNAGGSLVQLGAFPSEAEANATWAKQSKRLAYLAALGKTIERAEVNGRTVYRLRVNAGSANAAAELCGKLKVAGEACFIP